MKKEIHNEWIGRIQSAEALQGKRHKEWEDAISLYNCTYFDEENKSIELERVDVHFANWYIRKLVPLLYFRDPYIYVKSKHDQWGSFADTMEKVINYHWGDLSLKQEFKRAIFSALLMPPGWIKVGYTAKIGQDIGNLQEEKTKGLMDKVKSILTDKDKGERTPEEQGILDEYIKEESIFVSWVSSWNMLMPEGYHLVSKMPYLIEREDIAKTDFLRNPTYKNKTKVKPSRDIKDNSQGKTLQKVTYNKLPGQVTDEESDSQIIRLYHIWDRRNQKRYTVSLEDTHFEGDWPYDCDGFPHKPLYFDETLPTLEVSNPYPPNALTPILPQIIEQSQLRTQMSQWRKRAAVYILANKGLLTEDDIEQLEEAEDMQIAWISNVDAVKVGPVPNLPSDVFNVDNIIKQDLQMGTSMGQMMFAPQPGQSTATQAQLAQSGLQSLTSSQVDQVEDLTVDVAKSMAQLCWQFYGREKVSEIIGEPVTANMWPDLPEDKMERKKIIQAEINFRIDAGSTSPPKDETVDRKQLLDFTSIAASIAPERIKKDEWLKALIKKFKSVSDAERLVITNDNEEMAAAQKENELLGNNIPQVVTPNENHELHIKVHSQGPQTEAMAVHIMEHAQFMGITPQGQPQQGGTRPPTNSTNPSIARQGITNQGDINQSVQNKGVGTGAEAM